MSSSQAGQGLAATVSRSRTGKRAEYVQIVWCAYQQCGGHPPDCVVGTGPQSATVSRSRTGKRAEYVHQKCGGPPPDFVMGVNLRLAVCVNQECSVCPLDSVMDMKVAEYVNQKCGGYPPDSVMDM
jgi:hypothetical protein